MAFTTSGQETEWALFLQPRSPHGAKKDRKRCISKSFLSVLQRLRVFNCKTGLSGTSKRHMTFLSLFVTQWQTNDKFWPNLSCGFCRQYPPIFMTWASQKSESANNTTNFSIYLFWFISWPISTIFIWRFHHGSMIKKVNYLQLFVSQHKQTKMTNQSSTSHKNLWIFVVEKFTRFCLSQENWPTKNMPISVSQDAFSPTIKVGLQNHLILSFFCHQLKGSNRNRTSGKFNVAITELLLPQKYAKINKTLTT